MTLISRWIFSAVLALMGSGAFAQSFTWPTQQEQQAIDILNTLNSQDYTLKLKTQDYSMEALKQLEVLNSFQMGDFNIFPGDPLIGGLTKLSCTKIVCGYIGPKAF